MNQGKQRKKRFTRTIRRHSARIIAAAAAVICLFLAACSFNYGDTASQNNNAPNMVMEDAEYVRMTNGNPEVRLRAKEVRRYEAKHSMELDELSFEQFNAAPEGREDIPDINARGTAGKALLETDTNNVHISGNTAIEVVSEDMTIETAELSWQNQERQLSAPGRVNIVQPNGTTLRGTGFSADVRRRRWTFESAVEGAVVEDDEDEDSEAGEADEAAAAGEETAETVSPERE